MLVMKWIKMSVNMQSFRPKEMKTYTILSSISFEYVKIQCINRYGCLLVKWLLYVLNNVMMTRKTTTTKGTSAAATSNRKRDTTFTIWFVWEKKKGTVVNGHYTALHLISNQLKAVAILRRYRHFFFLHFCFFHFLYAFVMWTIRINACRTTSYFYAKPRSKQMLTFMTTYSMKFPGESTASTQWNRYAPELVKRFMAWNSSGLYFVLLLLALS